MKMSRVSSTPSLPPHFVIAKKDRGKDDHDDDHACGGDDEDDTNEHNDHDSNQSYVSAPGDGDGADDNSGMRVSLSTK